jgi:hypothetical protein
MKPAIDWRRVYTDAPELLPGFVRPCLQVLGWIFFHPSAWRSYVASIDPALDSGLPLIQITGAHLRDRRLRRLLLLLGVPTLAWIGVALALSWPAHRLFDDHVWSIVLQNILVEAVTVAVWSLLFGLGASVAKTLGWCVAAGIGVVVSTGAFVGDAHGPSIYGAGGLGIGLGLAIASSTGRWEMRKADGRLAAASYMGFTTAILARLVLAVPKTYAITHGGFGHHAVATGVASGVLAAVMVGSATVLRATRGRAATTGVVFGATIGLAAGLYLDRFTSGFLAVWCTQELMSYVVAFVVAARVGGSSAGVVAALLATAGSWTAQSSVEQAFHLRHLETDFQVEWWAWQTLGVGIGLTFNLWRPVVLYPIVVAWNTLLFARDARRAEGARSLLRYHSAFWDEHQRLRLPGLNDHVVLVHERRPAEANAALGYLSRSRQRWAVRAAEMELDARRLERCASPEDIAANSARASSRADEPGDYQSSFERIAQDVRAALWQASTLNRRLALRSARDHLNPLIRELQRSPHHLATRFHTIARGWSEILDARLHLLSAEAEAAQEIGNPYVTGVALSEDVEVFVSRTDVGAEIEQLILDKRKPPLLLYGQRRMGKTSLLLNLGKLLRPDLVPLYVDLQGPAGNAAHHAGFLFNIARGAVASARRFRGVALPALTEESLVSDPFTRFDVWLDEVETALGDRTALLVLDEMEVLDDAFKKQRFTEDAVLGMLRNLIQHRPRFKVLLAGSHDFEDLVRWSSYLINVRTVHLGYLTDSEARKLVEAPIPGFSLVYEPEARDRVLSLTRGHPFLVQLFCGEIVTHMNELPPGERRLARLADVEASVSSALEHGEMYFGELETRQAERDGAALLRRLANQGEGATMTEAALTAGSTGDVADAIRRLVRKEIVEQVGDGYRFKVELVRRWFASRRPVLSG